MVHLHVRDRGRPADAGYVPVRGDAGYDSPDSDIIIEVSTGGVSDLNIRERCGPSVF